MVTEKTVVSLNCERLYHTTSHKQIVRSDVSALDQFCFRNVTM